MSMNGCKGDPRKPLEMIKTQTFQPVSTPEMAMNLLKSAITELDLDPPSYNSGIIRLEVLTVLPLLCSHKFPDC